MAPEHVEMEGANETGTKTPRKGSNGKLLALNVPFEHSKVNNVPADAFAVSSFGLRTFMSPFKWLNPSKTSTAHEGLQQEENEAKEQRGFVSDEELDVQQRQETLEQANSESEQDSPIALKPPSWKRPRERDEYAVNESDGGEQVVRSKRVKPSRTAKTPIVQPKTSRGPIPSTSRRTRGNGTASAVAKASDPSPDNLTTTNGDPNGVDNPSQQPNPRKRGRPRKNPLPIPAVEESELDPTGSRPGSMLLGDEEGITDILLNPSPIKPPTIPERNGKTRTQHEKVPAQNRLNALPDVSSDSDDDDDEEGGAGGKSMVEEDQALVSEKDEEPPLIDVTYLQEILAIANRVGCKKVNGVWEWEEVEDNKQAKREKALTLPGKGITRRVNNLVAQYKALRQANETQDRDASQKAQENIGNGLKFLEAEIGTLITRLDVPNDQKKNTTSLLLDVYYKLAPGLAKVIVTYAKAKAPKSKDPEGTMISTPDLEEFECLVEFLYEVAKVATGQESDYQPRRKASESFQIAQPTKRIMPMLRNLLNNLRKVLKSRAKAEAAAERERLRPERERRRQEEKERAKLADAQRRREIHRRQREGMRAKLADPDVGPLLRRMLAGAKADKGATLASYGATARFHHHDDDEAVDVDGGDDPFGEDEDFERIEVFQRNNRHDTEHGKVLSREEMNLFVEIMRKGYGDDDRYEEAALQLHRSMDEIFAIAKEFQEAMDNEHENGRFTEPEDYWTYDVWVAQNTAAA